MMNGIIGKKVGMTQIFDESGQVVSVTVIEAGPCYVTQVRTPERDGYSAVQLGYGEIHERHLTKAEKGHLNIVVGKNRPNKKGEKSPRLPAVGKLSEFRQKDLSGVEVGQKVDVSIFAAGEVVDIIGVSKGRGFQGGMKRHNFRGGAITHGQSDRQRAPGSVGAGTTPGRVLKGLRMAGHMGDRVVTSQNIKVVLVDPERNLLLVRGSVPGANNSVVTIQKAAKG
ncbi:MAG: 50S ribosomal protein L3 [Chloroflexi bacterium]|nr:50S ribosomal protein L3 [Chloroflexota bacterium]